MRRPFSSYVAMRDEQLGWRDAWRGAAAWLLVVACFVSWTTSGRLHPAHLLLSPIAWAWAPALQMVWVAAAARRVAPSMAVGEAIALYHRGHGPWWIVLWLVAAFTVVVPEPRVTVGWSGPLAGGLVVVAAAWSAVITVALFRGAFGCDRRSTAVGVAIYYGGVTASIVGFYGLTGQLAPILGVIR